MWTILKFDKKKLPFLKKDFKKNLEKILFFIDLNYLYRNIKITNL